MYRAVLPIVFSLVTSASAIHAAQINLCTSGTRTLSDYIALGSTGCLFGPQGSIGGFVVSGFQVLPTASTAILPDSVLLLNTGTIGVGGTLGFEISFRPVANTGQVFEANFGFNVSALIGRAITREVLGVGGGSGDFDSPAVSTLCAGPISAAGSCSTFPAAPNLQANVFENFGFAFFTGTPVLGVTIDASAYGNRGTVHLRNIGVGFGDAASVPEPATMGMLAVALSGLVLAGRRKRFLPRRSRVLS